MKRRQILRACLYLIGAACLQAASLQAADTLPLEEKARFERLLEEKVEVVLNKVLGPGMAKVTVETSVDFTRVESYKVGPKSAPRAPGEATLGFLWETIDSAKPEEGPKNLLPGFPTDASPVLGPAGNQAYEHKTQYSADFIRRLSVSLILNERVPAKQAAAVEDTVRNILGLDPERGDSLRVIKMRFSSPWETIWQSAESAWFMIKYGVLIALTMVTLLVVGVCLLRLSFAMSQMARAQLTQVQMDFPQSQELGSPTAGLLPALSSEKKTQEGAPLETVAELELTPELVADLPLLLAAPESSEHALPILFLLKPEQAAKALGGLPEPLRQELALRISETVQIDPDKLGEARERLRRFVDSHVPGEKVLKDTMALLPEDVQAALLERLGAQRPRLARQLRQSLLHFEDLAQLEPDPLGMVLTEAPVERLALALRGVDPQISETLLKALPEPTRAVIAEYTQLTPPQPLSKIREARKEILEILKRLAAEGRVGLWAEAQEPVL